MNERKGQSFGKKCWNSGMSVEDTLKAAAKEAGLESLPKDPTEWPGFIHGAEEAWQDKNLGWAEEQNDIERIAQKHTQKEG